MTVLKCLNKILDKYRRSINRQHDHHHQQMDAANQLYAACFAKPNRTTFLAASIPSASQHHSIKVDIKRVKQTTSMSVCGSCRRNETHFCKCCGKQLPNRSIPRRNRSKKALPTHPSPPTIAESDLLYLSYHHLKPKQKETTTSKQINYLKKSQAMINIAKDFKYSTSSLSVDRSSKILF